MSVDRLCLYSKETIQREHYLGERIVSKGGATMRKVYMLCMAAAILSLLLLFSFGCRGIMNPIKGIPEASIDWVDFVKLKNGQYTGMREVVLADPELITEDVVGEVEFKVGDVVTNGKYRIQRGDAAYLEKGTKLYRVEGYDPSELIAAHDEQSINGYRIYVANDKEEKFRRSFTEIINHDIEKMEWYSLYEHDPIVSLDAEQSKELIGLLQAGKPNSGNYNVNDAEHYELVIYYGEPLAYSYSIIDDGQRVLFRGDENTLLIDQQITQWLH